jgi:hypothetical protein
MFGFAVIARSDLSAVAQRAKAEATKQSILPLRSEMDCFASLAMTTLQRIFFGCLKIESALALEMQSASWPFRVAIRRRRLSVTRFPKRQFRLPAFESGRSISMPGQSSGGRIGPGDNE